MKTLSRRSIKTLLFASFIMASLNVSPVWAQDEADDVIIEDTSTSLEEPIEDSSEVYTESDE
ncbi:MAG: hypothetical protein VXV96_15395 [Bdellovibrionota bacterium]|jgi:hypothetical protein|nr:hypothetical protein [Bdellovibrionota bacterium]